MSYMILEKMDDNSLNEKEIYDKWMDTKKEKKAEEKVKVSILREKRIKLEQEHYKIKIKTIQEKWGNFWEYNDINIPWEINKIPHIDGCNSVSWIWSNKDKKPYIVNTLLCVANPKWDADSHRKEFAEFILGKWYFI